MEKDRSYANPDQSSPKNEDPGNKAAGYTALSAPQITLPKGGGAIKSIDDKFSVNAANGTAGFSIPFPLSPSRNEFMPALALSYNSGSGNGIFGLGWNARPPAITRKTEKQLPQYDDGGESDIFIFSGAEDLVPAYKQDAAGNWIKDSQTSNGTIITRYRPRIEGAFTRIEKITEPDGNTWWKTTTGNNIVSIFGRSRSARVADPNSATDPNDPANSSTLPRIFSWLLEFSYDDKGNCYQLGYKKEDKINVPASLQEKNRLNDFSPCANTYLKRIKYANRSHFDRSTLDSIAANSSITNASTTPRPARTSTTPSTPPWDNFLSGIDYLLELVLDYGEHDPLNPQPTDDKGWPSRTDPFSDYRAGFEIRTWRLCQRVLMFHHFTELGAQPCLVRSMDLEYKTGTAFTFLNSVTQKGYIRHTDGSYSQRSLPTVEFTYEQLGWNTDILSLPAASLENLPTGIDDHAYQWLDLYNEGIAGILTEQAGGWYYKANSGDGNFEAAQLATPRPSQNGLSSGALHFQDIEAKGQQFLVSNDLHGYYELGDDNEWQPFSNFTSIPNIDLRDPNLKMLDLDGDGIADLLISEDEVFTWYAAKGKQGFGAHKKTAKTPDEERGPAIVFADSTQSIVLADMSGDGLTDIVRIRYSEVVYWPNLGYGKFGAKVSMSNAPLFDNPENFNPRYLKLADLDGSGSADLVYLGQDSFKIWFNQAGNSWSATNLVKGINPLPFPKTDTHSSVTVIDLLGNGTGCIVWSSSLPQHTGAPLLYIDLMGGKKPHIMTAYRNNMGKEVSIEYKSSTFFYLADKKNGTPWITRLPFPVQCVSQTVSIDQVRKSRFTNQYSYHHGYYDHAEREFRGFGRVDQADTEDYDNYKKHSDPEGSTQLVNEIIYQPPVFTRTWYHTGAFLDKEKVLGQFAHEYYQNNSIPEQELTDPPLPASLTVDEWREALRACKTLPLRTEIYSPDGSIEAKHPYTTTRHSCLIRSVQPRLQNRNAVFAVQESESLTYNYERNPADPRIAHSMIIEADAFGNPTKTASIAYGRKTTDPALLPAEQAVQSRTHIVFSENSFSNKLDTTSDYRLPLSYETMSHELTGLEPASGDYFSIGEISSGFQQAARIPYESLPTTGQQQKRLIEQLRTLFVKNDLTGPLGLGLIESLALPFQSYKLSMTPTLRDFIFGDKASDDLLLNEGKYTHLDDDNYWIASGTQTLDPSNFYQPIAMTDPFGFTTRIAYDTATHFFVQRTTDALGNSSSVQGFNFRTLSPYLLTDINDNRSGVRSDELGMVIGGFVMGKENENKGDRIDSTSPEASPADQPSTIIDYSLSNYLSTGKPNFSRISTRESHYFDDLAAGRPAIWRDSYTYVCGGGTPVMQKTQAEPGIALQEKPDGTVTEVDTTPNLRWIGSGRTQLNNKANPVKQYEPYFSTVPDFEDAKELVERGVTSIFYYDPTGRPIRTDMPNGAFGKVEFDAWTQHSFDPNDTVLDSQWYKDRITTPVPAIATPEEIAAANKTAAHANTPITACLDALGRSFLSIADNGAGGKYRSDTELDIEGNHRKITDGRGNAVMEYKYDMLGAQLYRLSMDAGERWTINDVMGKPLRSYDSRGHLFRYEFDTLHRPVKSFVRTASGPEINFEKMIYGEDSAGDKASNLRGRSYQRYDEAGLITHAVYDFKGNLLQTTRQLCTGYKNDIDWNGNPALDSDIFTSSSVFDALNRPVTITSPDLSIITSTYNEAGLLNAVDVQIKGAAGKSAFIKNIDYDARRQRQGIVYGNNTVTGYQYDPRTFRLAQLLTTANNGTAILQKLLYTYDPVGNITTLRDAAQQTAFFSNTVADPSCDYTYDAIYRLTDATGREHIGQNKPPSASDESRTHLPMPGDGAAMRNYTQRYQYDAAGNILQMIHAAGPGSWTRAYTYDTESNRLNGTATGANTEAYTYDAHGNILALSGAQELTWNFKDQLQQADLGGGGTAYYVYDASGQRIRKVIERQGGIKEQRIYLNGFELYRKTDGAGNTQEETETLHVMDDNRRIAMVETKTIQDGAPLTTGSLQQLIRYQYGNHLGSSSLELDDQAIILSYEEYHPFGTTAYQAISAALTAATKRYRYTGMERDDETGLEYHSARYYLPWLGRWLSCDPIGIAGGMNVYMYCNNNPCNSSDPDGQEWCWNPFASDCGVDWDRVKGVGKTVAGIGEIAAAAVVITAGLLTCELGGLGCVAAGAGALVMLHGIDTMQAGFNQTLHGVETDTLTSGAIQDYTGLSRRHANMIDGGIGIVGTLGTSYIAQSTSLLSTARSGSLLTAEGTQPSISIAFKPRFGPGHNRVGVDLGDGMGTAWSDLKLADPGRGSSLIPSGPTVVEYLGTGQPGWRYTTATVPVSAEKATEALNLIKNSIDKAGTFSATCNNCATYAAEVLAKGGVAAPRVPTPLLNYLFAAAQSPAAVANVSRAAAAADAVNLGATAISGSDTKPNQANSAGNTDSTTGETDSSKRSSAQRRHGLGIEKSLR